MELKNLDEMSERDFVVSCIISTKVCKALIQYVDIRFFEVSYSKIVMRWVIDYFNEFREAPGNNILSIYRLHCEELDEALQETVLIFLQKLEYDESINEDYLLSKCRDFLEYRKCNNLVEDLNSAISVRDMKKAREYITSYQKVDVVHSSSVRLTDSENKKKIEDAISNAEEILFTLSDENINKVIGDIHREDFIALLAGPKAGKTWFLIWIAVQAMLKSMKVVFVSLEMSEGQVLKRIWSMLFGIRSPTIDADRTYELSRFTLDGEKYVIDKYGYQATRNRTMTVDECQQELKTMSHGGDIWIETYPSYSSSVKEIQDRIREIAQQGYIPDVVIVDYADIMKPSGGGNELRNQLDSIWKLLRSFAQEMKVVVFTASQTNRGGLAGKVQAENVAEDMRKLAHVTSFVALERPKRFRELGIAGMKSLMARNESTDKECVFCTGYNLGQFTLRKSKWKDEVVINDNTGD